MKVKDISAIFISQERFVQHCAELASDDCTVDHLRLFHSTPQHTASVFNALLKNHSVNELELSDLDAESAERLSVVTAEVTQLCTLTLTHIEDSKAVQRAMIAIGTSLHLDSLNLTALEAPGVCQLSNALQGWRSSKGDFAAPKAGSSTNNAGLAGPVIGPAALSAAPRLRRLALQSCTFDAAAAQQLGQALAVHAPALESLSLIQCVGLCPLQSIRGGSIGGCIPAQQQPAPTATNGVELLLPLAVEAERGQLTRLRALDLSGTRIGQAGAQPLARLLSHTHALAGLRLHECALGDEGCSAIAAALPKITLTPQPINTNHAECDGAAAAAGSKVASLNARLNMDLSGNGIGPLGALALANALVAEPGCIRSLRLDDNSLGAAGFLPIVQAVVHGHASASACSGCSTDGAEPMEVDCEAMPCSGVADGGSVPSCCGVVELSVERNHIRGAELAQLLDAGAPFGAAAAAAAIAVSPALQRMSLISNPLLDAGTCVVCALLRHCSGLQSLDLRECGVGDVGLAGEIRPATTAAAVGEGLRSVTSAAGGAVAGGEACVLGVLRQQLGLRELNLEGNRIHNRGGQALLTAVAAHGGLWSLRTDGNKIADPSLKTALHDASSRASARKAQSQRRAAEGRSSHSSSSDDEVPAGYHEIQAMKAAAAAEAEARVQRALARSMAKGHKGIGIPAAASMGAAAARGGSSAANGSGGSIADRGGGVGAAETHGFKHRLTSMPSGEDADGNGDSHAADARNVCARFPSAACGDGGSGSSMPGAATARAAESADAMLYNAWAQYAFSGGPGSDGNGQDCSNISSSRSSGDYGGTWGHGGGGDSAAMSGARHGSSYGGGGPSNSSCQCPHGNGSSQNAASAIACIVVGGRDARGSSSGGGSTCSEPVQAMPRGGGWSTTPACMSISPPPFSISASAGEAPCCGYGIYGNAGTYYCSNSHAGGATAGAAAGTECMAGTSAAGSAPMAGACGSHGGGASVNAQAQGAPCRRPVGLKYKPLTADQQRLFCDF